MTKKVWIYEEPLVKFNPAQDHAYTVTGYRIEDRQGRVLIYPFPESKEELQELLELNKYTVAAPYG